MIRCPFLAVLMVLSAPLASPARAEDAPAAEGNFSGSLVFPLDRQATQTLIAADTEIRRAEVTAALRRLQQLLDQAEDSLAWRDDAYISASEAANDMIRSLSPADLATYRSLYEAAAQVELAAARDAASPEAIARLTDRFRHTTAGHQAATWLAAAAFDRGDRAQAADWIAFSDRELVSIKASPLMAALKQALALPRPTRRDDPSVPGNTLRSDLDAAVDWTVDLGVSAKAMSAMNDALGELDAQARTPLLNCQPLRVGERIIARTMNGFLCVDAATGQRRWERPMSGHVSRLARSPGELSNPVRSGQIAATFLRRLVRDSLLDAMTSDGRFLYALDVTRGTGSDSDQTTTASSRLLAIAVETGEIVWATPPVNDIDSSRSRRKAQKTPSRFYLGPPLVDARRLLVLAQQESTLELVALESATGDVLWTVALGRAVRNLSEDRERLSTACLLARQGTRVVCPTAAGGIVCVDTLKRRIVWARRAPRRDLPEAAVEPGDATQFQELPLDDRWPAAVAFIRGTKCLWMAPESAELSVCDLRTGRLHWSRPRGDGLDVLPVGDDRLVLIESTGVRAIALASGAELWRTTTPQPAGRGVVEENLLLLPIADERVIEIPLEGAPPDAEGVSCEQQIRVTGRPPTGFRPVTLQNLSRLGDIRLSQSPSLLRTVPDPSPSEQAAVAPGASSRAQGLARLLGEFLHLRHGAPTSREILFRIDSRLRTIDGGLMLLIQAGGLREAAAEVVLRSACRVESSAASHDVDALTSAMALLQPLQPDRLYLTPSDQTWTCRLDRWLAGRLREQGLPAKLPDEAPVAASMPATEWPPVRPVVSEFAASSGPSYFIRIPLTVASTSPWNAVTVEVDRQGRFVQFQRATDATPTVVPLPLETSMTRQDVRFLHGWAPVEVLVLRIGAELIAFRLSADGPLPEVPLWPEGQRVLSLLGPSPPLRTSFREIPDTVVDHWDPSAAPFADVFGRSLGSVGPVRADYLCYQERGHLVAIEMSTGRELWRQSRLPIGTRRLGDDAHVVLFHPSAEQVRVLSALDGRQLHTWDWPTGIDGPPVNIAEGALALLRGTHVMTARPVNGQQALTAIDLVTGKRVWERTEAETAIPFVSEDDVLGFAEPAAESQPGGVTFLDWRTGETVARCPVAAPEVLTDVYTMADTEQIYVILSAQVTDASLLTVNQIRGDFRRPEVDGWIHAFRRPITRLSESEPADTARPVWSFRAENLGIPLDQPRHVPLIVVNDVIQTTSSQTMTGRLLCLDQRTGERLISVSHPMHIYYAIDADQRESTIDLRMSGRKIRFDYHPDAPDPASPSEQELRESKPSDSVD